MKKALVLLGISAVFCLMPVNAQKRVELQNSQARVVDILPSAYTRPVVADVEVDTKRGKIRDEWKLTPAEYNSRLMNDAEATVENLRIYAAYKSTEKYNCDIIVSPTFDISVNETGAKITITGYTANLVNWHSATPDDYTWILNETKQRLNTSTAIEEKRPNGRK